MAHSRCFINMNKKAHSENWFIGISRLGIVAFMAFTLLWSACSQSKNEVVDRIDDESATPTLRTLDVETLISDSGVIRYRIKAPEWLVYEHAEDPYWYFPRKLHVEKFDSVMGTEALIQGDTAIYYNKRQLWRLDKNVRIENQEGDVFLTQQIFWDQRKREIYSDSFIRIETPDEIIEGHGFTSNEQMTRYTIRKTSGIFPIKQDSVKRDSAASSAKPTPRAIEVKPKAEVKPATLDPNNASLRSGANVSGPLKTIEKR